MRRALSTVLGALTIALAGSVVGLTVNALRPAGIPLVAPLPYEQDCPDKVKVPEGPEIEAPRAVGLLGAPDVLFIDARPAEAYAAGHIPGARSIPFSFISPPGPGSTTSLKKMRHLVVYCDSPGDKLAGLLAQQLRDLGLKGVKVLRGGYPAYRRAATKGHK